MNAVAPVEATGAEAEERVPLAPLTLRVLSGRSVGAEHRLPERRKLLVGHSFENDIVLRDRTTRGCALHIATSGRRGLLEVVSGNIEVLGRSLSAGDTMQLEPYLPVRIGDVHFAIGCDDEERWAEAAEVLSDAQHDPLGELTDVPRADLAKRLELRAEPVRRTFAGMMLAPRHLAIAGAAMLAIAGGAYFGSAALGPAPPDTSTIQSDLAALGFPALAVEHSGSGGEVAIVGLVRDDRAAAKLREWGAANYPGVVIGVGTVSGAAEAASELLAAQNVEARAVPEGVSDLAIEGPFLPKDRQQELTALLRQDVPRVREFIFKVAPNRGEADLAYFFNAPGFGAASFVAGDPGYIVTEDGTRWFEGAALPTGHKIVEIGEGRVTVEREGLRDTLAM
ncbi:SctD/MshK family protein [Qipengyuania sp. DGS5-3]|uniref:SctD/MshK family protein n=1 Tax=Qipengyuania sp. DGS5-3 TaxID=3349632 RepID=UPI0036D3B09A